MNEFIKKEVEKILNDEKTFPSPLNQAMAAAWLLGNMKGINLKVLNVSKNSSLADYYVMGSASNQTQADSMADSIIKTLRDFGIECRSQEGGRDSDWTLIDLGNIIVHIFLETARDVYALDQLWKEADSVEIPQEYYFSGEGSGDGESEKDELSFF